MCKEFEPKYIGSVTEYLQEIKTLIPALENKLKEDYPKAGKPPIMLFYRGEDRGDYLPSPAIYRKDKAGHDLYKKNAEESVLKEFASHFHEETQGMTAFEKLLMAQHYGLPTRLLDVTLNPLVALYFACKNTREENKDAEACVHIFAVSENMDIDGAASDKLRIIANLAFLSGEDKQKINENSKTDEAFNLMKEEAKSVREGRGFSNAHGGEAYTHLIDALEKETGVYFCRIKRHNLRRAYFVRPVYSNPRIRAQEGGFIVSGFAEKYTKILGSAVDKLKKDCADGKRYAKLLIKDEHKEQVLQQLDKLGVNEKTLFPEMERVAGYIGEKYKREIKYKQEIAVKANPVSVKLADFIGKHFFYVYENGWRYEMYIKNSGVIDYRIHSGMVGGRWVRDQQVIIVPLGENIFKVSWDEPTGTVVSLAVNLSARKIHCFACFPRWIKEQPQKTICFQNEHLEEMQRYRDEGKTYPHFVLNEWANITFLEDCGADNEAVINLPSPAMPTGEIDTDKAFAKNYWGNSV